MPLNRVSQHLVHPRYLRRNAVINRSLANLNDKSTKDIRVHFRYDLKLLALAVLGFAHCRFQTFDKFRVEVLTSTN